MVGIETRVVKLENQVGRIVDPVPTTPEVMAEARRICNDYAREAYADEWRADMDDVELAELMERRWPWPR